MSDQDSPATGPEDELLDPRPFAALPDEEAPPAPHEEGDARSLAAVGGAPAMGSPIRRLTSPAETPSNGGSRSMDFPAEGRSIDLGDPDFGSDFLPPPPPVWDEEIGAEIRRQVTPEDLAALSEQIDALYGRVESELAGNRLRASQAMSWLNEARTLVMARPEQFPLAELRIQQVRLLLRQSADSDEASRTSAARVGGWNLLWLIVFLVLFAADGLIASALVNNGTLVRPATVERASAVRVGEDPGDGLSSEARELLQIPTLSWYFPPWRSALLGGIGGALAALSVFALQTRRRQYEATAAFDYYLNPFGGFVLGLVMYYILLGGFLTVAATTALSDATFGLTEQILAAHSALFLVIAFITGTAQSSMLALLQRIWDNVTGADEPDEEPEPEASEATRAPVPVATVSGEAPLILDEPAPPPPPEG